MTGVVFFNSSLKPGFRVFIVFGSFGLATFAGFIVFGFVGGFF
jgi:hypothetical protein